MTKLTSYNNPQLPTITNTTKSLLDNVTSALGVSREVMPGLEQIEHVWSNLPRLLGMIPPDIRDERMMRLCVAVAAGLFDSAINYAWNLTIVELRKKVIRFGLPIVSQITSKQLDENKLLEITDYDLLKLCLELSIITEDGYFKLDQCREIRNNFSAAHPAVGLLDEDEVVNFISRCAREALSIINVPAGVDFKSLVSAIKGGSFSVEQTGYWSESIKRTHFAQRELISTALHGMYCDENLGQTARNNCALLFPSVYEIDGVSGKIIDQHQSYIGKGETSKAAASRDFFTKFGMIEHLSEAERHSIISIACDRLMSVHQEMNNFYTEPAFAERLSEVVSTSSIPDAVRDKYVHTVVACAIGNGYGVSWGASSIYENLIRNFTPKAIESMLLLPQANEIASRRIATLNICLDNFRKLVSLLNEDSIPVRVKPIYDQYAKKDMRSAFVDALRRV